MSGYLAENPLTAATNVHRESTQMADVLFEHALLSNHDVLVDGSLRDVQWYQTLFQRILTEFPNYRISILYVSATKDVILNRAQSRAEKTGRAVPNDLLQASMEQVPKSVSTLAPLTHVTCEISNNDGEPIELISQESATQANKEAPAAGDHVVTDWVSFANLWNEDDDLPPVDASSIKQEGDDEKKQQESVPTTIASSSLCDISMICDMSSTFHDERQHEVARAIWGASYPKMCPRCALFCDGQCGICIHNRHICACEICKPSVCASTSK